MRVPRQVVRWVLVHCEHGCVCQQGFESESVRRCTFQQSSVPSLRVDEVSQAAAARMVHAGAQGQDGVDAEYLSLFMEAAKSDALVPPPPLSSPLSETHDGSGGGAAGSSPHRDPLTDPVAAAKNLARTAPPPDRPRGRVRRALQWVVKRVLGV